MLSRADAGDIKLDRMDSVLFAALEVFLTVTGRLAVWLFSFGRWRGEPLGSDEGRIFGPAGALSFVREGHRVVTHTGQFFAGIAVVVALAALGILYAAAV